MLRKKFGIEVGKYSFYLNMTILAASIGIVGVDKMLYGIISCFISGQTTDSVLSSFDRRRLVFIVVEQTNEVVDYIRDELHRGSTVLFGEGGYTGEGRCTIMSLLTARQAMVLKERLNTNFRIANKTQDRPLLPARLFFYMRHLRNLPVTIKAFSVIMATERLVLFI